MRDAGLIEETTSFYRVEMEVERLLGASFPNTGDADEIRRIFADAVETDNLGLGVHQRGAEIHFAYPTAILVGRKPA
jgi:hypothetical protein